jgi:decaprenylphospho-beta-D-ribofuranose 2-oxidase
MRISGWGRHPIHDATMMSVSSTLSAQAALKADPELVLIPRGMGRSYGDSALASVVIDTTRLNHLLAFDDSTGLLRCGAGVTFKDILDVFVPRGWFIPAVPGTRFITVGGAIASDVHGKGHHQEGSFSSHLRAVNVLLGSGEMIECSPVVHQDLFKATCGGMGLTGVITEATIQLQRIGSAYLRETTVKSDSLVETIRILRERDTANYSVAWLDCLTTGAQRGRGLVMSGEFLVDGKLAARPASGPGIPVDFPEGLLNRTTMRLFNTFYYHRKLRRETSRDCHYTTFFFPLDAIGQWNRIYGRSGFVQYQFVVPTDREDALDEVHRRIVASGRGSFLAVLKSFGPGNDHPLSFPMAGLTLAVDFRWEPALASWLDELDAIVVEAGGRIYLTKDCRMSLEVFRRAYPQWTSFVETRHRYHGDRFQSLQSRRLGL